MHAKRLVAHIRQSDWTVLPTMRSTTLLKHVSLTTAIATTMVGGLLGLPTVSYAKTVSELDEAIASIEANLVAKEQAVTETQAELSNTIKATYKSNQGGNPTLTALIDANGLESMVSNEQYARSINKKYVNAINSATAARDELSEAKATLEALRAEKIAQQEARKHADSMHFCQWGEYYSDIRYFCGTIGSAGCGLCAYTSAVNILKGTNYTPDTMLSLRGDWAGTEEYIDSKVGSPNGQNHADWTESTFDIHMETLNANTTLARQVLEDNEATIIICSGHTVFHDKAGVWRWSGGHYVLAYRCDEGGFYVHDSSYKGDNGSGVYYTDAEMQNMLDVAGQMIMLHN